LSTANTGAVVLVDVTAVALELLDVQKPALEKLADEAGEAVMSGLARAW
jgi:hypothetical protein